MPVKRDDLLRIIRTTHMLRRVWLVTALVGLYSLLPVFKEHTSFRDVGDFPSSMFTVLGLILSLVLVFRTNRAYDRWWEARTQWGKLVNISRNLAVKCRELAQPHGDEPQELQRTVAGFSFALKEHLRSGVALKDVPGWGNATETPKHVPNWLTGRIYAQIKEWQKDGRISPQELLAIDTDAHEFLNVCGACERIRNTLIAGSYRSYALKCLLLYLLALPWGLVEDLNWLTVPIVMIVAYMMLGLEAIAEDVEEPFGYDLDDLDLDALCRTIDVTTAELLDVEPLRSAE
jgi:putative membrane protein